MEFYSPQTLDKFKELLTNQVRQFTNLEFAESQKVITQIIQIYNEFGSNGSAKVFRLLKDSQLRKVWNETFATKRSAEIANWIVPYYQGNVLDLICGDGKVGQQIINLGNQVDFCDRHHWQSYNNSRFINYENFDQISSECKIDTALLITVLHHQPNPELLLQQAFNIANRVIVVENIVTEYFDHELHRLFDEFANNGLNQSGDATPNNHKTIEVWRDILNLRGEVIFEDFKSIIPGVPLPHQLYVINRRLFYAQKYNNCSRL
jgi:hypothetical protein